MNFFPKEMTADPVANEAGPLFEKLADIRTLKNGKTLKVISLFSGCGGFSLGFRGGFEVFKGRHKIKLQKNPYKIVAANEQEPTAIATYKKNFGINPIDRDIRNVSALDLPDADVIIGGFPCQDFSIAGKMGGLSTERGRLYKEMVRLIKHKKPLAFVAENVKNLLNPNLVDVKTNKKTFEVIINEFAACGYKIFYKLISCPEYGLPQNRERVFVVGLREDISTTFLFPKPCFKPLNCKDAIDDLWWLKEYGQVPNHDQMSLALFKPPSRVGNQGNYQLKADKPSYVMRAEHHMHIQAHYRVQAGKDPANRKNWRRLTVREAARLQSFPDSFVFEGSKFWTYKQIGNAVPPMISWCLARALYNALN
jgi:DNA (cytosine-5)-methyltransferase 1